MQCGVIHEPLSKIFAGQLNVKNWYPVARCRSDWRKKTGETTTRKWAREPHEEAEVTNTYKATGFNPVKHPSTQSDVYFTTSHSSSRQMLEARHNRLSFTIFIAHDSPSILFQYSVIFLGDLVCQKEKNVHGTTWLWTFFADSKSTKVTSICSVGGYLWIAHTFKQL